jgi:hypothetical protein
MEAPVAEVIASTEVLAASDDHHDDLPASKPALTPPTSEDMDKRGRSSSELSELSDDEDEEDIEPDHYFEGGKIPVFKPVRRIPSSSQTISFFAVLICGLESHNSTALTVSCDRLWTNFGASRNLSIALINMG